MSTSDFIGFLNGLPTSVRAKKQTLPAHPPNKDNGRASNRGGGGYGIQPRRKAAGGLR